MAITWEALVRLISNLEKAHTQVPSNIAGKFQLDWTSGCWETAVTDTQTHTEIAGIIDRWGLVPACTSTPIRGIFQMLWYGSVHSRLRCCWLTGHGTVWKIIRISTSYILGFMIIKQDLQCELRSSHAHYKLSFSRIHYLWQLYKNSGSGKVSSHSFHTNCMWTSQHWTSPLF